MKNLLVIIGIVFTVSVFAGNKVTKLAVGDKANLTEFKMDAVSGEKITISDAAKENGVLVLFSCNACPFVLMWQDRYNEIKQWADKNNVGMLVLNSNYRNRDGIDSFEAMKAHALKHDYRFDYVVDHESKIANAFGGQTTPHAFLLDKNFKVAYKGAIDDNANDVNAVKKAYLKDAIASLGANKEVVLPETPPVGCSIKRKIE